MPIDILGGIGFPNGKRRVRWNGYAPIMMMIEARDPMRRTVGELIAAGTFYSPKMVRRIRRIASRNSRYVKHHGVTGRAVKALEASHDTLSREYRFLPENDYVEDMDAADAIKLLSHDILRREYAYADVANPKTTPGLPNELVYQRWGEEARRRPDSEEMKAVRRILGGRR